MSPATSRPMTSARRLSIGAGNCTRILKLTASNIGATGREQPSHRPEAVLERPGVCSLLFSCAVSRMALSFHSPRMRHGQGDQYGTGAQIVFSPAGTDGGGSKPLAP